MTYNLRLDVESDELNRWDNRKEALLNQILFYEPDVFGTQEGLPHQIIFLDENLKTYKAIGEGRDGGNKGESVSIFYKEDRLKVIEHSTFWLSKTPNKVSKGWDAHYPRICTYALFEDISTKRKFWVFNLHLDHAGVEARKESLKLIDLRIRELNKQRFPVVIMGDFNLEPKDDSLNVLENNYLDTKLAADVVIGQIGTFNGFKLDHPFNRRIDYIWISKSPIVNVDKYAVFAEVQGASFPSDHFPVFASLNFSD